MFIDYKYNLDDDSYYYPLKNSVDSEPETKRSSVSFTVTDNYEVLFLTTSWTLYAKVGNTIIASSKPHDNQHAESYINVWARQVIKTNKEKLESLGVDVGFEYSRFGGVKEDI